MACSRWQNLQGFEELNDRVAVIFTQIFEPHPLRQRLARMGKHRFAHGCVQAVMPKRMLVGDPPQFARNKLAISGKELRRTSRLVHVNRLTVRVSGSGSAVVQLEIGECRHPYDPIERSEARCGQLLAGEINFERRRLARA